MIWWRSEFSFTANRVEVSGAVRCSAWLLELGEILSARWSHLQKTLNVQTLVGRGPFHGIGLVRMQPANYLEVGRSRHSGFRCGIVVQWLRVYECHGRCWHVVVEDIKMVLTVRRIKLGIRSSDGPMAGVACGWITVRESGAPQRQTQYK